MNCKEAETVEANQIIMAMKLASKIESGIGFNETYSEVSR